MRDSQQPARSPGRAPKEWSKPESALSVPWQPRLAAFTSCCIPKQAAVGSNGQPLPGVQVRDMRVSLPWVGVMRRFYRSASLGLAAVLCLASSTAAQAQDLTINGLADLRLVRPSGQSSWMQGGLGKLRFDDGGRQSPDLHIGQILADARLKLGPDALVFASVRYVPEQKTAVDLTEAYARYQPIATTSWLWSIKTGAVLPPTPLENEAIGWTSPSSITPSAINCGSGAGLLTFGAQPASHV